MVLNEMICPACQHVSYKECSHITCASCGTHFSAARGARRPIAVGAPVSFRVMVQNRSRPVTVVPVHSLQERPA